MLFCNLSTPKTETSTQEEVEKITPTPNPNDKGDNEKNKKNSYTTTTTIITLYYAGSTVSVTTTNDKGETITYETYIPPSTVLVVKKVAVTADLEGEETVSDSTILHDFNSHGLWGVVMSLFVVSTTL